MADSGEDAIAFCSHSDYAANIELATSQLPEDASQQEPVREIQKTHTPDQKSCADVAEFLGIPLPKTVKTLAVTANGKFYLLLLRGDHQLNELKVRKIPFLAHFEMASDDIILRETGTIPGFIGPLGLDMEIIADPVVMKMRNFACGANEAGFHYINVNFDRDLKKPQHVFDIRNVCAGDLSPDGKARLKSAGVLKSGIYSNYIRNIRN